MGKTIKIVSIIAAAMVALGVILAVIGGFTGGFQPIHFGKDGFTIGTRGEQYSEQDFTTKKESLQQFTNIDINVDWSNVEFIPADQYEVEYTYLKSKDEPRIDLNGTDLIIRDKYHNDNDFLDVLDLIGVTSLPSPKIKIYYPQNIELNNIKIESAAGEVSLKDLKAKKIDLDLDLGDVDISNVSTEILNISLDAGDCALTNVNATSGDISLDLGSLNAQNLNSTSLEIENSAGDISIQGTLSGKTSIDSDMGDVKVVTTLPEKDYNYKFDLDLGDAKINDNKASNKVKNNSGAANQLEIDVAAGDIRVDFAQ